MKRYSLKKTLFNMFIQSVLLPFALISIIVFGIYYGHILNNYRSNSKMALQSMNNHLESYMEGLERFFLQYLFDERISDFYHYVNTHEIGDNNKNMSEYAVYNTSYSTAVAEYRIINDGLCEGIGFISKECNENKCFYLQNPGGLSKSSLGYKRMGVYEDEKIPEYSWYQSLGTLKLGDTLIIQGSPMDGIEEYSYNENRITLFKRCNYVGTGRTFGYIFLEISENKIASLFENISIPEGSSIIVYTPKRDIVYATNKEIVPLVDEQELWVSDHGEYATIGSKGYYIFNTEVEEYDFVISYLLPQKIIFNQVFGTSLVISAIWCVFIVIAFFLYTKLSSRVSASAKKVIQYIDHYRMGTELENQLLLADMSIQEFEDISKALLEMTDRINGLVEHEYIAKLNQQMAEYAAIQAEVNPHFFHNIMNIFQALNRMGEREKLEKGIINLSRMFRYTCEHGYESSIKQECRFIESYLILEKLRFEERINYSIYVEEGLNDFPIPKLLFQPIIENAMYHGLPDDGANMEIRVEIRKKKNEAGKEFILITIANDGNPHTERINADKGVGIVSVKERLRILYSDSVFWYDKDERFQTICNMLIPLYDTKKNK